jgi:hypothetical protein
VPVKVFDPFFKLSYLFSYIDFEEFYVYFGYQFVSRQMFYKDFLSIHGYLFIFLTVSFTEPFLILMKSDIFFLL